MYYWQLSIKSGRILSAPTGLRLSNISRFLAARTEAAPAPGKWPGSATMEACFCKRTQREQPKGQGVAAAIRPASETAHHGEKGSTMSVNQTPNGSRRSLARFWWLFSREKSHTRPRFFTAASRCHVQT